jgi:hypothetical protein
MFVVTLFCLAILTYVVIIYINIRLLKGRVEKWSSNMGVVFFTGIGRKHFIFISLNESERLMLKKQLAKSGDIASDKDLESFLHLYSRCILEVVVAELMLMLSFGLFSQLFQLAP